MVPYPEGALDESGRVRCGGDAIGFWERTVAGKQGEGVARGREAEKTIFSKVKDFRSGFEA